MPLIVRLPGTTPKAAVCDAVVLSMDLHPTIAAVTGCQGEGGKDGKDVFDGLDVSPILKDLSTRLQRNAVFFHYPHCYPTTTPVSAVRQGPWKLLEYHEDDRAELYHLGDDPGEANDLAAERPEKVKRLRRQLARWLQDVDAQMPRSNPNFEPKGSWFTFVVVATLVR